MVKITDVAAKAGVAKSTVSNVLTGKKFVSEELRKKVLAACAELDFHPNFYASGLSSRKTNIIALLLEATPEIATYPFYKDLILSCLLAAQQRGYSLLLYYNENKSELLKTLRQGIAPIDGAIMLAPSIHDERLSQMATNSTACVVVGRPTRSNVSNVDVDNKGLVKSVAQHLISLYGKEVYLLNSSADMTISQDRNAAFCEVCQEHGINYDSHLCQSTTDSADESYQFALQHIKAGSAFITANETRAAGIYRAAQEKGLAIGKEVGVFALGRSVEHGKFTPKLSYAYQSYQTIGKIAVDTLIDEIETGKKNSTLVQSEIRFRDSTARE